MSNAHEFGRKVYAVAGEPITAIAINQFHPAYAGTQEHGEDVPAGLHAFEQWLDESRQTIERVNQVRGQADPSLTEAGHVLACADAGENAVKRISKGYDSTRLALEQAAKSYEAQINQAVKLTPTQHAAEVRAVVRALPAAKRFTTIITAMEQGDTATLAAVLDAPGITSGLTDEQRDNLREMWVKKAAPRESLHLDAVRKAQRRLMVAFDSLLEHSDSLTLAKRAADLRAKKKAAQEAAKSLKPSPY